MTEDSDPTLLFAEMIDVIGRTIDGHPRRPDPS